MHPPSVPDLTRRQRPTRSVIAVLVTLVTLAALVTGASVPVGGGRPADASDVSDVSGFWPVDPVRDVDTRQGRGGVRLAAGEIRRLVLPSIPAEATAVTANVTAIGADAPGHLTVTGCADAGTGGAGAASSALNFQARAATANQVTVGTDGSAICVTASAAADVLVDVAGYVAPGGGAHFVPAGARLHDTRGQGWTGAPGTLVLDVPSGGDDVVAWSGTVTATNASSSGYVTVWPCARPRPVVSNLNLVPGAAVANHVTVGLPAGDRRVCAHVEGSADLVVDTTGTWRTGQNDVVTPSDPPHRVVDTRPGDPVLPGEVRRVHGEGPGVAFVNLTATRAAAAGWLAVFECGAGHRGTSTLNVRAGRDVAAASVVAASDGGVCVTGSVAVDVVVDVFAVQHAPGGWEGGHASVPPTGEVLVAGPATPQEEAVDIGPCVPGSLDAANQARAAAGLAPLLSDGRTDDFACEWATTMAASGVMAHSPDDLRAAVDACGVTAENVGVAPWSPDGIMPGWLESGPHRANVVNAVLRRASVAYVERRDGGLVLWYGAMVFGGSC